MKKIIFILVLCLLTIQFTACSESVYYKSGIENFHVADSSVSLNDLVIPRDFLKTYPYIDGGYDYYEYEGWHCSYSSTFLYMKYDEATYLKAKEYILENLPLECDASQDYKGYTFFIQKTNDRVSNQNRYRFYFAHNDVDKTLLAMGTFVIMTSSDGQEKYENLTLNEYLNTYFSFYNFEEGKIERETETESQRVESLT